MKHTQTNVHFSSRGRVVMLLNSPELAIQLRLFVSFLDVNRNPAAAEAFVHLLMFGGTQTPRKGCGVNK